MLLHTVSKMIFYQDYPLDDEYLLKHSNTCQAFVKAPET